MTEAPKTHIRNLLLLILTLGLPLVLVLLIGRDLQTLENIVRSAGVWGFLLSISLIVLFGFTPLPAEPIAVMNGILFGPVQGAVLNMVGNMIASLIEYYVGTRMTKATNFESPLNRLHPRLQKFSPDSLWFLIGFRFIPQVGSKIVSFGAGIFQVPIGKYVWTTFLANLVGSVLLALAGFGIIHV